MRRLFIVLTLFGVNTDAQQLNVASYNVRNSNPNDAKAGMMEQRYPLTQLITFTFHDILERRK